MPLGDFDCPLNPIKMALASGMSFIARCNARDITHTSEIIQKAIKHRGFAFVEIIQDCIIFNKDINNKDGLMYKIPDNKDKKKAEQIADEWNYNDKKGKIAVGVIYQKVKPTLDEKWPQLTDLKSKGIGWNEK